MPIKRYYAKKDNTITNAKRPNSTIAADANMGQSDSLEVFRLSGSSGEEESKIIIKFDPSEVSSSAENLEFPINETKFYLRLFNVRHDKAVPQSYNINVGDLESDFDEGYGLDMETYEDLAVSNWVSASSTQEWTVPGGGAETLIGTSYFEIGTEDLLLDVTEHVSSSWCSTSPTSSGGFMLYMPDTQGEHYTKKFSARGTNYFYKKPCIEARWESVVQDNGGNLYKYTDRLSQEDNAQSLYLYNWVNGELKQIPDPVAYFKLWTDETFTTPSQSPSSYAATNVSTGVYKVDYIPPAGVDTIYYTWERTANERYLSGSIKLLERDYGNSYASPDYDITISNLKPQYSTTEIANMRMSIKQRDRGLNIYTVSQKNYQNEIIENLYYKITRRVDDLEVIPYGNGTDGTPEFTKLSFDSDGNYFDLNMSLFEPGFMYEVSLLYKLKSQYVEYRNRFKFRVEK